MRNVKLSLKAFSKFISVLLIIMLLNMTVVSAAEINTIQGLNNQLAEEYADKLAEIGVFKGTDNGYELTREPTRLEGLVMLIRLLGKEEEANDLKKYACVFSDVPDWGVGYVNYAYYNGLTLGIGNGEFGSYQLIDVNAYSTFMLRALGYNDKIGDFTYNEALDKLNFLGVITSDYLNDLNQRSFLREDVAIISYNILKTNMKNTYKPLVAYLIVTNSIDQSVAIDIALIDDEIISERVTSYDIMNSNNGQDVMTVSFMENYIDISGEISDPSQRYLWIQIYDELNNRRVDQIISVNNNRFYVRLLVNLNDGKYVIDTYTNSDRYGTYSGLVWDAEFFAENNIGYFESSPVYTQNYREYFFGNIRSETTDYLEPAYGISSEYEAIITLANDITEGITNDYEKVLAIHNWVADNIYYNYDGLSSGNYGDNSSIAVLENKYGVCEGYANLFAALVRSSGIPCKKIIGYALGITSDSGWNEDNITSAVNHAWNEVYVDDRWIIIDVTWDSNKRYEDGQFQDGSMHDLKYFDCSLEAFSLDHRIK